MNQIQTPFLQASPGGSPYVRHILDIRLPGQEFKELIKNYNIGYFNGVNPDKLPEIQVMIYKESAQQIFDEMTHNTAMFISSLMNMPRYQYFDQYEVLFQDQGMRHIFSQGFRMFAMQLMQITFAKIPIDPNIEFFLESIGPDYMSVVTHPKNIQR